MLFCMTDSQDSLILRMFQIKLRIYGGHQMMRQTANCILYVMAHFKKLKLLHGSTANYIKFVVANLLREEQFKIDTRNGMLRLHM